MCSIISIICTSIRNTWHSSSTSFSTTTPMKARRCTHFKQIESSTDTRLAARCSLGKYFRSNKLKWLFTTQSFTTFLTLTGRCSVLTASRCKIHKLKTILWVRSQAKTYFFSMTSYKQTQSSATHSTAQESLLTLLSSEASSVWLLELWISHSRTYRTSVSGTAWLRNFTRKLMMKTQAKRWTPNSQILLQKPISWDSTWKADLLLVIRIGEIGDTELSTQSGVAVVEVSQRGSKGCSRRLMKSY
jgi:hypothetical protein